jgi:hypothetical protein
MKIRSEFRVVCVLMIMSVAAWNVHAASARDDLAQVVRLLGYGAGIHNFKNYVLRGRENYHADARRQFRQARDIIDSLARSPEIGAADQEALAAVRDVAVAYDVALDRVAALRAKGWRIGDIDRSVIIDDSAAVSGLDRLRGKWRWSDFEEMEYKFGYGKGIHDFKNYVLRGQDRYHTAALESLLAVEALVASQLSLPQLATPELAAEQAVEREGEVSRSDTAAFSSARQSVARGFVADRAALEAVERAARAYRNNLALVDRLLGLQRPIRQIDLAIKINDGPAVEGLARLRDKSPYLQGLAHSRD